MSNRSTILSFVQANPGLTSREISSKTGVSPIQQVNQILAFHVANGGLGREGRRRNYTYSAVTAPSSQPSSALPRSGKTSTSTNIAANTTSDRLQAIQHIVASIFASQKALRSLAPEFRWTGLGNLLGDYGELVALDCYELNSAPRGAAGYDATTQAGKEGSGQDEPFSFSDWLSR